MNIMKRNIILSLIVLALFSCKKENSTTENPYTLCFQTSNDTIFLGETINLTNCSKRFNNYEWDFGDGENSTLTQPNHTYQTKGSFSIKLTSKDDKGNIITSIKSVFVSDKIKVTYAKFLKTDGTLQTNPGPGFHHYYLGIDHGGFGQIPGYHLARGVSFSFWDNKNQLDSLLNTRLDANAEYIIGGTETHTRLLIGLIAKNGSSAPTDYNPCFLVQTSYSSVLDYIQKATLLHDKANRKFTFEQNGFKVELGYSHLN